MILSGGIENQSEVTRIPRLPNITKVDVQCWSFDGAQSDTLSPRKFILGRSQRKGGDIFRIPLLLPVEKGYTSFTVLKRILYAFMKLQIYCYF